MQLKEIKIILVFTFLTLSCSNRIQVGNETLILTDIVRNEITFNEKNKEEIYKLLNQENLLDDKDRWFYIDRKFYAERREILLDSSWVNSNRDDITIIWFSRNDSQRKLFEEYIKDKDIHYYRIGWEIAITYDERNKKILLIEYEF